MAPSRNSIRLLAEREETMASRGAGLGVSPPPVPASMAKTQDSSEFDVDMMDDVGLLANMLRGNFLDVQADAATAVAGLTADRECAFLLAQRFVPPCRTRICVFPVLPCTLVNKTTYISSRCLHISRVFVLQRDF